MGRKATRCLTLFGMSKRVRETLRTGVLNLDHEVEFSQVAPQ